MKRNHIEIQFDEYESGEPLPESDELLLKSAREAANNSYAPYSDFCVGAALLLEDETVVKGSNQENASYPLGLCAERVAIFHANSEYPGKVISAIAITANARNFVTRSPITPCGACRQVIAETETRQASPIRIIMAGQEGVTHVVDGIKHLLPLQFHEEQLKKKRKP